MKSHRVLLIVAVIIAVAYVWLRGGFVGTGSADQAAPVPPEATPASDVRPASAPAKDGVARAIFASGCFWCTEADFDKVAGVVSTTSGYTGGQTKNPDYKSVSSGRTGHTEAVEVVYDPSIVTYEVLLDHYWQNVDPFTAHRQFCDIGPQYRPEIFVLDASQRAAAERSKARVQQRFKDMAVVVAISDAGVFYPAEEYHQDYYKKNSAQYRFYRYGCGRDARLRAIWGDGQR